MPIRYFPLFLFLAACGPIPVQMSSQKQTQSSKQEVAQEVAQDVANDLAQQAHQGQGTSSMPVIIICNTNNSANASCATLPRDGPMIKDMTRRYGKDVQ